MQYQVPQFIEVEDKIFGPLTFKQFAYVAGGAGMCFIFYRFLPIYIAIFFIVPIGGFALALAFYKVNKRPFILIVDSAVKYYLASKLYIWKKVDRPKEESNSASAIASKLMVPKLSNSKLRDLTWSLDINETIYSKEQGFKSRDQIHNSDSLSSFKGLSTDMEGRNT